MEIVYKKTMDLIPYVNNTRTHSDKQVNQIASSIKEFGFTNPILIDEQGGIIAGHGRLVAANKLKMQEVPCIVLDGLTEAQKKAYIIADNKLALNAGWDEELLRLELENLKELDFDIDLLGFDKKELLNAAGGDENPYTKKVEIPQYEPQGDCPSFDEMVATRKTDYLIEKIKASGMGEEEKSFLLLAAQRHLTFSYKNIAEYYCHANEEMQELMEESALVLIDYEDAIKNGFVVINSAIEEMLADEME